VVDADTFNTFKSLNNTGLIKMFFTIFIPSELEPEVLQFVGDVVKDTGKEEYMRQFIRIALDSSMSRGKTILVQYDRYLHFLQLLNRIYFGHGI